MKHSPPKEEPRASGQTTHGERSFRAKRQSKLGLTTESKPHDASEHKPLDGAGDIRPGELTVLDHIDIALRGALGCFQHAQALACEAGLSGWASEFEFHKAKSREVIEGFQSWTAQNAVPKGGQ